jgi:hypothetical protein
VKEGLRTEGDTENGEADDDHDHARSASDYHPADSAEQGEYHQKAFPAPVVRRL